MSTVVFLAVLFWCHASFLLEYLVEMTLRCKRKIACNICKAVIAVAEEVLGSFDLGFPDVVAG